jgi:hypothetical protein
MVGRRGSDAGASVDPQLPNTFSKHGTGLHCASPNPSQPLPLLTKRRARASSFTGLTLDIPYMNSSLVESAFYCFIVLS